MAEATFFPKISVIVPVYNCEAYVGRCLESILSQDYRNIEIIVVDDGSTDGSTDICKAYANRDSRVVLIRQSNGGLSAARNTALDRATGEYVAFVDGDDYIDHDMLDEYVMYLTSSPDAIAVSGFKYVYDDDDTIYAVMEKYRILNTEDALEKLYADESVFRNFMWNKIYKRSLFNNIRFPEGQVYEDISVQYKLFESTSNIVVCPFCSYNYVQRKKGISRQYSLKNILDCNNACLNRFADATIKTPQILRYLARSIFRAYVDLKVCGLVNIRQRRTFRERNSAVDARVRALGGELRPHMAGYKFSIMWLGWHDTLPTDILVGLCWVANKLRSKIIWLFKIETRSQHGEGHNWLSWLPGCATDGSWILMDRDTQADDNAEHLYDWIRLNHPEQKVIFALSRSSHDWQRLVVKGFDLVDISSPAYIRCRLRASVVASSQADDYIFEPVSMPGQTPFRDQCNRFMNWLFTCVKRDCRYVFLQHGVIMNDLAEWLNSKPISLFITSASGEYRAITSGTQGFRYTANEVKLTGLPRHDALVPHIGTVPVRPRVTVMPTWRAWLLGKPLHSNRRPLCPDFMKSRYARVWQTFLTSEELRRLQEKHGFAIDFYLHANMQPYLPMFNLPSYVRAVSQQSGRIQQVFSATSLIITDYSSVAFEQAFLMRPVIYYQFDAEEFFGGKHVCKRGYFDYAYDGFGPVVYDEASLLQAIMESAECGFKPQSPYLERMQEAFPWRDGRACERVYEKMLCLETLK